MERPVFHPNQIEAHRGASASAPENTIAAFARAAAAGAGSIECDLSLLADGNLAVFHDSRLGRIVANPGGGMSADTPIASLTAADIALLDAGAWKGAAFAGERIPLLTDALAFQRESKIRFNWEMKSHGMPPADADADAAPAMIEAMAAALEAFPDAAGLSLISSFDRAILAEAARRLPAIPRALAAHALPPDWREAATEYGLAAIHLARGHIGVEAIPAIKEAGLALRVFTVNDPYEARYLLAQGVDAVITDRVEDFLSPPPNGY